jgi:hypothetical protein
MCTFLNSLNPPVFPFKIRKILKGKEKTRTHVGTLQVCGKNNVFFKAVIILLYLTCCKKLLLILLNYSLSFMSHIKINACLGFCF